MLATQRSRSLKGPETFIATPYGEVFRYSEGEVGLATSGSGDILAGVLVGFLARGATLDQAAVWAVYLHGSAGNRLKRRMGAIGFLARELSAEIPALMNGLSGKRASEIRTACRGWGGVVGVSRRLTASPTGAFIGSV